MNPYSNMTQEERMTRRRVKVEAIKKKKHAKARGQVETNLTNETKELQKSKKQIKISRDIVDDAFERADEAVGNVLIDANDAEMRRRRVETEVILKTRQHVDYALTEGDVVNAKIEEGWEVLATTKRPEELAEGLQAKKEECLVLDLAKKALMKELGLILQKRDEDYTKQLKSNVEDVGATLTAMKAEFRNLHLKYEDELQNIEHSFVKERAELLEANDKELHELFDLRLKAENNVLKDVEAKEDMYYEELHSLRLQSKEEFNNLKVTLENNIQMLQQQLEEMRSTYQLNVQKLEYNLHILKERDVENRQTVDQYRKRIHKLQEQLSKYTAKYKEENQKFKRENAKYTKDYRRITEKFKDLQLKYRQFSYLDTKKYSDVFEMNRKNILELSEKVMTADRVIHNQILGKEWSPSETFLRAKSSAGDKKKKEAAAKQAAESEKATEVQFSNEHVRQVMALLAQECQFLIDSNTLEACKSATLVEGNLLKADAILSSIGIQTRGDLERLCNLFFNSPKDSEIKVELSEVVNVLREFIFDSTKNDSGRTRDNRTRKGKEDQALWENLMKTLPPRTERTWAALEQGLIKYNKVLKGRQEDIDETNELLRTNEELKMLLRQYLESKNNDAFQLPPTHHIECVINK